MIDIEKIAAVCHEANRRYCAEIGDASHKSWEETPWSTKQSAIAGVAFIQENPDASLQAVFNSWKKHRVAEGWVRGEKIDIDAKQHPCLVPYEELPEIHRVKDRLFRAVALSLLNNAAETTGETDE